MTPLRIRFSNHALNERADRIAYIATTIGFGEVIARKLVLVIWLIVVILHSIFHRNK